VCFCIVLWIRNDFFFIRISGLDPTFQIAQDPGFVSYMNFSNIFNINFTFVFPSCSCKSVRLHITMRYKLFRGFLKKGKNKFLFFKLSILFGNCQILLVFQSRSFSNSFRSGAIRIRILLKV
jgi:hypothetical protein